LPIVVFDPELKQLPDGQIISIGGYTFDGMIVEWSNQCLMYTPRVTSVNEELSIVTDFSLSQNYPNPFNPGTSIQYAVSSRQFVTLKVYDVLGNEVATIVNEEKPAGSYEVEFSAIGGGRDLASGIYIYRLTSGPYTASKKLMLLK
jgi:hypothetical protein